MDFTWQDIEPMLFEAGKTAEEIALLKTRYSVEQYMEKIAQHIVAEIA